MNSVCARSTTTSPSPLGDHIGERVPNDVERGAVGFAPKGDDRDGTVGEHASPPVPATGVGDGLRCD